MNANPHEQHRERLRKMFLYCHAERLPDHMLLEMLLCYAIPRADTNPIAHELIRRFGSIENVFDADVEDLMQVEGIGENSALLLKMIPLICDRYAVNKLKPRTDFRSVDRAVDFFREYYISKNKELVCALLLDNAQRLICHVDLYEGAVNSSNINPRKLAQIALSYNAASLILAHNHPSGDPTPSSADLYTTKQLMKAFAAIDLNLRAHLIIAGNRYVDAVQTVYENANYEVKYVAVRADNLPQENPYEEDLPLPPREIPHKDPARSEDGSEYCDRTFQSLGAHLRAEDPIVPDSDPPKKRTSSAPKATLPEIAAASVLAEDNGLSIPDAIRFMNSFDPNLP